MSGTITAYDTAAGKRYRVRYRKPDKSQTDKRGFRTKREAEVYLASVTMSKATGDYIDPAASRATIRELGIEWLRNKQVLKASSYHSLEVAWRVYVEPRWGATPVGSVKPTAVETWIGELAAGSAVTARVKKQSSAIGPRSATVTLRALGVLAGILDAAVRDGRLPRNPARGARNLPQKNSSKRRRYLTDAEVIRLATAADDSTLSTLVMVLAYCGIRWGEAIGLRVADLNMLRHRIHVNQSAVEVDGTIIVGAPKNWEKRTVPFADFLTAPLAQLCKGKPSSALVFAGPRGEFLRRPKTSAGTSSWFLTALTEAGVERLTPHDLRHTAASLAVSSGANVKAVQRMLGHKSAAMTLDTYADLFDSDLDDVAKRLGERAVAADVGKVWANRSA